MKSLGHTVKSLGLPALLAVILLPVVAAYAQEAPGVALSDPRMVVIPARSTQEVTTDIDNAEATRQLALSRKVQASARLDDIQRAIKTRETSLKDIDRRKDDAKKGKRESEQASLKIESGANKDAIDLLKRLRDLRKAELDEAGAEAEHAGISIRSLQLESQLQDKRVQYNWQSIGTVGGLTQNTAQQVLGELEVQLLKLQNDLASATEKLASKQKDVVSRRMKLHDAQLKLGMSRM